MIDGELHFLTPAEQRRQTFIRIQTEHRILQTWIPLLVTNLQANRKIIWILKKRNESGALDINDLQVLYFQ
jgi:hypothetical protein